MKVLCVASTLDLRYRLGCTPSWWQLLKAFHEEGHEVIATAYLGDPIETPWWRTVPNPCSAASRAYNRVSRARSHALAGRSGPGKSLVSSLTRNYVRPRWSKHLHHVVAREEPDLVLFLNIPLNHVAGIADSLRQQHGVRVVYYDGDMPAILPEQALARGFKFSYYEGADLSEYDAFYCNSEGVLGRLRAMGAKDPQTLHYAVDPDLFPKLDVAKTSDVAFYGHGSELREPWMKAMIGEPSRRLPRVSFVAAGGRFGEADLGQARVRSSIPFAAFPRFVASAHVNLNITRDSHASVKGSSTARPFELAACGAAIVTQPYAGSEVWFQDKKHWLVIHDAHEAVEAYQYLLARPDEAFAMGERARTHVLAHHTWKHRVRELFSHPS